MANLISKVLKGYPRNGDRFRLLPSGVGRELANLLQYLDLAAFSLENGVASKLHYYDQPTLLVAGAVGSKVNWLGGWPAGYEKATRQWTFDTVGPKTITFTAVKPGELGDLIHLQFVNAPAAEDVTIDGMNITVAIDPGVSTPTSLQAVISSKTRLAGLVGITSSHMLTAIPATFVTGGLATAQYLAGGAGLGLGYDIQNANVWGNTAAIAFIAKVTGLAAAKYEVAWVDDPAMLTPPIVAATRKRCTITCKMGVHTVNDVVAVVNANKFATEHLSALATGDGLGVIAGLDGKVYKLGLDFGTMLQVGDVMANITAVGTDSFTFNHDAQVGVVAGNWANLHGRIGLVDLGTITALTA